VFASKPSPSLVDNQQLKPDGVSLTWPNLSTSVDDVGFGRGGCQRCESEQFALSARILFIGKTHHHRDTNAEKRNMLCNQRYDFPARLSLGKWAEFSFVRLRFVPPIAKATF